MVLYLALAGRGARLAWLRPPRLPRGPIVNLGASAIVLRPRSLAEILDLACRLCVSLAFGLYARLALVILLPILAGCLALRYAAGWQWFAVWLVAAGCGAVVQGLFTVSVGRLLFSEELSVGQALRLFGRRFGSYLAMLLLSRGLLALACLPFFVGLPFAWTPLFFVHEASLLEGAGAVDALRRSSRLVSGRAFPVFGALLAIVLTQGAFVITAELLCQGLVTEVLQLGKPFGSLFTDGGSPYALAGLLLSVPYVATARFLEYIDARTRSDGWDVQLRFMAIAGERRGSGARRRRRRARPPPCFAAASRSPRARRSRRASARAETMDSSVRSVLHDARYRFCHEDDYPLAPDEHAWCRMVGEYNGTCPSLPKACKLPPVERRRAFALGSGAGTGRAARASGGGPADQARRRRTRARGRSRNSASPCPT